MSKSIALVKLIMGIISSGEETLKKVKELLEPAFGKIDLESTHLPFDFTDYYEKEMGKGLMRCWLSFEKLIAADNLVAVKLKTQELERHFSVSASCGKKEESTPRLRRRINLDPGYISGAKLVLASTKNYSHRIYLGKGIFAEVALIYKKGKFEHLDWTYPDYRSNSALLFFEEVRKLYLSQTKLEA